MTEGQRSIPEELVLMRLAQSEQMRDFFIQMWLQNPVLAQKAGPRIQNLLAPLHQTKAASAA